MKELCKICPDARPAYSETSRTYSKKGNPITIISSIILALLASVLQASAASISGNVYDIVTGQPLSGITIVAENIDSVPRDSFPVDSSPGDPAQPLYYDTVTGVDGKYILSGLPPGRYSVYEDVSRSEFPEIIDAYAEENHTGIDIGLTSPDRDISSISGEVRLLESFGYPWFGEVTVFSGSGQIIGQTFVVPDSIPSNPSDTIFPSFETFEVGNLPSVSCKVCAFVYDYLPQYYNHAYWADSTADVTTPETRDIDFLMELGGDSLYYYGEISGIIRGPHGPLSYASVYARKGTRLVKGTISSYEGYYDIYGLAPGTYTVYATRPGYWTKMYSGTITIADQWEDGKDITLERDTTPAVEESGKSLDQEFLLEAFPNPFAANTNIRYVIPEAGPVSLKIYDATGRLVRTLVDGIRLAGEYTLRWDAKDSKDQSLSSGVYFARLARGGQASSKRLLLIR